MTRPNFPERPVRLRRQAMACDWELSIWGQTPEYAAQAAQAAWDEVERLEGELSRFRPSSDIGRLNAAQPGESIQLGADALECLRIAQRVYEQSGGAFDVTVGALVGAGQAGPHGWRHLEVDYAARLARVHAPGLVVDLGGIGKGYALDRVVEALREWSIECAVAHCGQSTVLALGGGPEGQPFRIGVRNPCDPSAVLGVVTLRDAALSGSGVDLHGRHIIDPRSGAPAERCLGAWSIAASAAEADALSTAFIVLGAAGARAYCAGRPNVSALVQWNEDGRTRLERCGPGFTEIGCATVI